MPTFVGVGRERDFRGQDVVISKQDMVHCIGYGGTSGNGGSSSASHSRNISQIFHVQMQELLIQDKRCMLSRCCEKMHHVKSSKTVSFDMDVRVKGSGASHVNRSKTNQQRHNNNNNNNNNYY